MTLPISSLPPHPAAMVSPRLNPDPNLPADLYLKAEAGDAAARAQVAWLDLTAAMGQPDHLHDGSQQKPEGHAMAWGYGQAMTAALDVAHLTGDDSAFKTLVDGLSRYQNGDGYAPGTNGTQGIGQRYYDDNAWIGLALAQGAQQCHDPALRQSCLQKAEQVFRFLQTDIDSHGGVRWHEGQSPATFNTCTEGPAMELALRLHMLTARKVHDTHDAYFQFAQSIQQDVHKQGLQDADGLFADHVLATDFSRRTDDIYSYNQGTPIGADVLFYRITGDQHYLQDAQRTAQAALRTFQGDRLFLAAPGFNAIMLRNLMALDSVAPDPHLRQAVEQYTQQAWTVGRNPVTGLYDQGGIGHYGNGQQTMLLDQAAFVQLNALPAWPTADDSDIA